MVILMLEMLSVNINFGAFVKSEAPLPEGGVLPVAVLRGGERSGQNSRHSRESVSP